MSERRRFRITVTNVSSFDVMAETEEQARKEANALLDRGETNTMVEIDCGSTGWEVTDVELG